MLHCVCCKRSVIMLWSCFLFLANYWIPEEIRHLLLFIYLGDAGCMLVLWLMAVRKASSSIVVNDSLISVSMEQL